VGPAFACPCPAADNLSNATAALAAAGCRACPSLDLSVRDESAAVARAPFDYRGCLDGQLIV